MQPKVEFNLTYFVDSDFGTLFGSQHSEDPQLVNQE